MNFATGRFMRHRCLCAAYEVEDVCSIVRHVYKGRVEFLDGDEEIAPGISLHLAPGHTAWLAVRARFHRKRLARARYRRLPLPTAYRA